MMDQRSNFRNQNASVVPPFPPPKPSSHLRPIGPASSCYTEPKMSNFSHSQMPIPPYSNMVFPPKQLSNSSNFPEPMASGYCQTSTPSIAQHLTPSYSQANTRPLTPSYSHANTRPLTPSYSQGNTRPLTPSYSQANTRPLTPSYSQANTRPLTPSCNPANIQPSVPLHANCPPLTFSYMNRPTLPPSYAQGKNQPLTPSYSPADNQLSNPSYTPTNTQTSIPSYSQTSISSNSQTSMPLYGQSSYNIPPPNPPSTVPLNRDVKSFIAFPPPPIPPPSSTNISQLPPPSHLPMRLPPPPCDIGVPPPFLTQPMQSLNAPSPSVPPKPISREEELLCGFLNRFKFDKKPKKAKNITVAEFRSSLKIALKLLKELLTCRQKLETILHNSEEEWKENVNYMAYLQAEVSKECAILAKAENFDAVQKRLKIIMKKRAMKRKQKLENMKNKVKEEQDREILTREIDKWLDSIKEKNQKLKREVEMKKEADNILAEVRRKIHEGKKTLEKMKVFDKLRYARQLNALQKGLFVHPEHTAQFEEKTSDLKATMRRQLSDYEAEERALKVMLETEQEGQLEEEAQWRIKKMKTLQKRKQQNILQCLFGDAAEPSPDDPLFLFYQHHNSGNTSIESLVQIRHQWDMHLSECGECVPQPWVVPVAPSHPSWEEFCK